MLLSTKKMSSNFACCVISPDPAQAVEGKLVEGSRQVDGGRKKGMGSMVEGASRRAEEGDWRAGSCRSQAEVTGEQVSTQ